MLSIDILQSEHDKFKHDKFNMPNKQWQATDFKHKNINPIKITQLIFNEQLTA